MAGFLGIAETAILGSSIAWSIDRRSDQQVPVALHSVPSLNPEAVIDGYSITSTGDNPRYWTAYRPGGRDGKHELAAGAGEMGLAKCIRAAERHLQTSAV